MTGKLSNLPFLVFCLPTVALFVCRRALLERARRPIRWLRETGRQLAIAAMVLLFGIWACYGFELEPIADAKSARDTADQLAPYSQALADRYLQLAPLRLPLRNFVRAIRKSAKKARAGHPSYLNGRVELHGFRSYFLVTTALKLPLGTLAAVALALGLAIRRRRTAEGREVLLLAALGAALLASASIGAINIGHRHVLSLEPILALIAGGGVQIALGETGRLRRAALGALLAATAAAAVASLAAHPDALGYTNALAGQDPDRWLVDSNIDWGQDLDRLGAWLRTHGVDEPIRLAYFGNARPERHGVNATRLAPDEVVTGWIAISATPLRMGANLSPRGYHWLLDLQPVARIGTSIRVYRVTAEDAARLRSSR